MSSAARGSWRSNDDDTATGLCPRHVGPGGPQQAADRGALDEARGAGLPHRVAVSARRRPWLGRYRVPVEGARHSLSAEPAQGVRLPAEPDRYRAEEPAA